MDFEQQILKEMERIKQQEAQKKAPAKTPNTPKVENSGMNAVLIFGGIIALLMIMGRK